MKTAAFVAASQSQIMKHNNTSQNKQSWVVVRVAHNGDKKIIAEYDNERDASEHVQTLKQLIGWRYQVERE